MVIISYWGHLSLNYVISKCFFLQFFCLFRWPLAICLTCLLCFSFPLLYMLHFGYISHKQQITKFYAFTQICESLVQCICLLLMIIFGLISNFYFLFLILFHYFLFPFFPPAIGLMLSLFPPPLFSQFRIYIFHSYSY